MVIFWFFRRPTACLGTRLVTSLLILVKLFGLSINISGKAKKIKLQKFFSVKLKFLSEAVVLNLIVKQMK